MRHARIVNLSGSETEGALSARDLRAESSTP